MTKRKQATTLGAERLLAARDVAAKELGVPVTDWLVKRYAVLMVAHDNAEVELATGGGNIDHLLKLDEAMQAVRASAPTKPKTVEVKIVEGVRGIYKCRFCGRQNELKPGEYTPLKPDKPPVIEGTATEVKPSDTAAAAAKPATDKAENKPAVAPNKVEKPQQSPKWQGEGDRAFMPAVNFVEGVEGWTKRPSVWRSRGNSQALFGPHGGGLRANPPSPPPSQACQNKNYR